MAGILQAAAMQRRSRGRAAMVVALGAAMLLLHRFSAFCAPSSASRLPASALGASRCVLSRRGGLLVRFAGEDLSALTVAVLKERCKEAGLPAAGKKADLIARLEEASAEAEEPEPEPEEEKKEEEAEDLTKLPVGDLKARCRKLGLPHSGKKADVIARLEKHAAAEEEEDEEGDGEDLTKLSLGDLKSRCRKLGLPHTGKKADVIARLEAFAAKEAEPEEEDDGAGGEDLSKLPLGDLKARCRKLGVPHSGKKADVIARLEKHAAAEAEAQAEEQDEEEKDEEEAEEEEEASAPAPAPAKAPAKKKKKGASAAGAFQVGEIAEGYYEDDNEWYEAKVLKDLGSGAYNVAWTEDNEKFECQPGYIRKKLSEVDADGPFQAGEAVSAYYADEEVWYNGIIQSDNGDGTFTLMWDEDGEEHTLKPEDGMRKIVPKIELSDLKAGQKFKGLVGNIRDFGTFIDVGATTEGLLRQNGMKDVKRAKDAPKFDKGERVTALYDEEKEWYSATVDKVNKDGTFTIIWDEDGDEPYKQKAENIKLEQARMPFKFGDEIDVWIHRVNLEGGKFLVTQYEGGALGPLDPSFGEMDPYEWVDGVIYKIIPVGFLVRFESPTGVSGSGMVHLSQIRNGFVDNPQDEGEEGQEIKVRVMKVDYDNQRIGLSMRDA